MPAPPSVPSPRRFLALALLVGLVIICGFIFKFVRDHHSTVVVAPPFLAGVLPNFLATFVISFALFASPRIVALRDFLQFVGIVFIAFCAYEAAQLLMRQRTFDFYDIAASLLASVIAIPAGYVLFFVLLKARASAPPR